jgi:hypothetical protein
MVTRASGDETSEAPLLLFQVEHQSQATLCMFLFHATREDSVQFLVRPLVLLDVILPFIYNIGRRSRYSVQKARRDWSAQ